MCTQGFQADITSGDGLVEFAFLPTVAGIEAAGEDGLLTGQVEIFTLIAVRQRFGDEQLVQSWLAQSFGLNFFGTDDVEDNHFILTFLQPASRDVEGLLRADFPNASHGVPVDVDKSLAPSLEV